MLKYIVKVKGTSEIVGYSCDLPGAEAIAAFYAFGNRVVCVVEFQGEAMDVTPII